MKDFIREKDIECVASHLTKKRVDAAISKLRLDLTQTQQNLRQLIQDQCTIKNTLLRARYLRGIGLTDALMLSRLNPRFETEQRLLEHSVHKRSFEASLLEESARVMASKITAEGATYFRQVRRVHSLKQELQVEVAKLQALGQRCQHLDALKLERLRLEKSKLLTQGKVRALEEELETPMHVHRWRFLEGTNPELAQLLKMMQSLRGRLIVKIAAFQRCQATAEQFRENVASLARHVRNASVAEHDDAVLFFEQVLRQKTKQLSQLEQLISGQKGDVEGRRCDVGAVRAQLNDTKGDYFYRKKQSDQLRAQSMIQKKSTEPPLVPTKQRFIGGGFAVAASADRVFPIAPTPLIDTQVTAVIVPKLPNALRLLPKG
jgi:hypothetical protein